MVKLSATFAKSHTPLHTWLFFGFLSTFTLSIRKVLFFYPLAGQFNEYTGIYLYLSDIFLILTLLTWGYHILYNNNHSLSNTTTSSSQSRKNVPCGTFLLLPLLLVLWSFSSLIWADNKILAVFRSLKLAEFYLLYLYLIYNVPRGTFLKNTFRIIIGLGIFQSAIALWQFVVQHSIGLTWLHESLLGSNIPGVAKLVFGGQTIIRAYGTFPHPNILGGFLLISILLTYYYHQLFHLSTNVPRGTFYGVGIEQSENNSWKAWLSHPKTLSFLIIQVLALLSTFSKSAIIGLILAFGYLKFTNFDHHNSTIHRPAKFINRLKYMFHPSTNVPRGTFYGVGVEHMWRKVILLIAICLVFAFIAKPDTNSLLFKSLSERLFYLDVSRETILAYPAAGIGSGQFVWEIDQFVPHGTPIEPWQYQPVHNVFLLIWSELGIIGLGLFLWFLWKLFHVEQKIAKPEVTCSEWNNGHCEVYEPTGTDNVPRGTSGHDQREAYLSTSKTLTILKGALIGLIFIILFDHYPWDIQQGEIMLLLVAGLLVGAAQNNTIDKYQY